jgi:hypothetical protein
MQIGMFDMPQGMHWSVSGAMIFDNEIDWVNTRLSKALT